jgi:carboxyl-terminal processing protease
MQNLEHYKRKHTVNWAMIALIVCSSCLYGLASKPSGQEISENPPIDSGGPDAIKEDAAEEKAPLSIVDRVCEHIYQGEFDAAGELIEGVGAGYDSHLNGLLEAVHEYQAINEARQWQRQEAYREQLEALEQMRVEDGNETIDVNNITKVLSIVSRAGEFADKHQRQDLLSNPFVEGVSQQALDRAAELESQGKWLDAYIVCYSWLQTIEPNNRQYSDYAEQLVEKANIVGSFQDSPCETSRERYEKVEERMFVRAIDALHFNYVKYIDYPEMATRALGRCQLLAEVIGSSEKVREALFGEDGEDAVDFSVYDEKLAAWSVALKAIRDEIDHSVIGLSKKKFLHVFENVLALNLTTIQLPNTVLIAQFAEAALSVLDPYTVMVWPRQVQDFEKTMTNEFTGIGIEITKQKGLLTVASLLPDTPAYTSGLDAGDVIECVDTVATKDMSLTCAVRRITGPSGTEVKLTIRRPGEDQTRAIAITRARIKVPTIRGWQRTESGKWLYTIDDQNKIGYVRITSFSASTPTDFEEVLSQLEARGLKGLILDLRFNTGGLLDSAVEIVDRFIDKGVIVTTRKPKYLPTYAFAHEKDTHPNYPLVVLINRASASASEIVSGALQDKVHNRAVLVGERTHGKGSVQGITPYPGGSCQLKYTMAYYHLPSGQRVESKDAVKKDGRDDWGVGPDIKVRLRSDEIKKMIDVQRNNDVLIQANGHNRHSSLRKRTTEETLTADPQLAIGLLVVKSKLIQEQARNAVPIASAF